MTGNPIILVAEDDPNDVLLLSMAFKKAGAPGVLIFVQNGREVIDYLEGKGTYGSRSEFPLPTLLLVDLSLPGMNGFEVLAWVNQQPALARLKTGMLTGMEYEPDIAKASELGAAFYIVKPHALEVLVQIVIQLGRELGGASSATNVNGSLRLRKDRQTSSQDAEPKRQVARL